MITPSRVFSCAKHTSFDEELQDWIELACTVEVMERGEFM